MTAEVRDRDLLSEFAPKRPFPAKIPNWVPEAIARAAREARGVVDDVTVRLTVDPRMRQVWAYLMRTDRRTGRFRQPARVGMSDVAEASKRQDFAMLLLFEFAKGLAAHPVRPLLRRDLDKTQRERQAIARRLWREANLAGGLEEVGVGPPRRAKILSEAADVIWRLSTEPPIGDIVVDRDRGEGEAHTLAVSVAEACQWLFGAPLYTLTAIMCTVALDRPVSKHNVRKWWSTRPPQRGCT